MSALRFIGFCILSPTFVTITDAQVRHCGIECGSDCSNVLGTCIDSKCCGLYGSCSPTFVCYNGGQCNKGKTPAQNPGQYCMCNPGYFGMECLIAACQPPCPADQQCVMNHADQSYHCASPASCTSDAHDCSGNGKCQNVMNSQGQSTSQHYCQCNDGNTGEKCEKTHVVCNPPCSGSGGFTTVCVAVPGQAPQCGLSGNCASLWNLACTSSRNGKCIDGFLESGVTAPDGHVCQCFPGFTGANCNVVVCNPACPSGLTCAEDYTDISVHCVLPGSCTTDAADCSGNGKCHNVMNIMGTYSGQHYCMCNEGSTGEKCQKSAAKCNPPCKLTGRHPAECVVRPGNTPECGAPGNCSAAGKQACSDGNGKCVDAFRETGVIVPDGHLCECFQGFIGVYCNVPVCSPSCPDGEMCIDSGNRKTVCRLVGPCSGSEACSGHGICEAMTVDDPTNDNGTVTTHYCQCQEGFTGIKCETEEQSGGGADQCRDNPCENGAKCISEKDGYSCHCKTFYTGKYCECNVTRYYVPIIVLCVIAFLLIILILLLLVYICLKAAGRKTKHDENDAKAQQENAKTPSSEKHGRLFDKFKHKTEDSNGENKKDKDIEDVSFSKPDAEKRPSIMIAKQAPETVAASVKPQEAGAKAPLQQPDVVKNVQAAPTNKAVEKPQAAKAKK